MALLEAQVPAPSLSNDLLEEAATNLCSLVKDKCQLNEADVQRLEALATQCEVGTEQLLIAIACYCNLS